MLIATLTVLDQSYTSTYIELEIVTYYAFAEYDDGTYGFWAAGKAGWFELQSPAGSFRDIYDKMNEAASIFYTLADRLKRAHRRAPSLTTKEVHKYARKTFRNVGLLPPNDMLYSLYSKNIVS